MTRLGVVFWLVLVLVAGFTTFRVKYTVQDVEDQLYRVRKQTIAEQQEMRVLTAEWTYLNQPERLADLNQRFLSLVPITPQQLQTSIENIPMRAPEAAPDVVVAAAAEPAAPPPPASKLPLIPAALGTAPAIAAQPAGPVSGPVAAGRPAEAAPVRPAKGVPVQLAKASPADAPHSLDALIAQIADSR